MDDLIIKIYDEEGTLIWSCDWSSSRLDGTLAEILRENEWDGSGMPETEEEEEE